MIGLIRLLLGRNGGDVSDSTELLLWLLAYWLLHSIGGL
jgi:hypothetical protein